MNVFITGGAGFIGTAVANDLVAQGHNVTVFDIAPPTRPIKGVHYVQGDVRGANTLAKHAVGHDYIFHLAAVVGVRRAMEQRINSLTTNFVGTLNALEVASREGIPILISSSSAIYGKTPHIPTDVTCDIVLGNTNIASWTYSIAKLSEEALALAYCAERDVDVKIARLFNCYGPNQSSEYGMVIPSFVSRALQGKPLHVYGDGRQTRTFLYIKDCVRALNIILSSGRSGEVYNIGGEAEICIGDLAQMVLQMTESDSEIILLPYREAFGKNFEEPQRRVPAINSIGALGYTPVWPLRKGLEEVIAHLSQEAVT